ncbi:glycine zipper 2TM domain-containing protein [Sphingomonas sp. HF-S3]|uniref:17 kDa surface antigen n=1 Tax=Sphingomonas rustica TaxID=3103142 RepID=A0ABV0B8P2_9SPHN
MLTVALGAAAISALPSFAPEASAQTRTEQQRWNAAQSRYDRETQIYERERDLYEQARRRRSGGNNGYYPRPGDSGYNDPRNGPDYDDRYRTDYDASRYYRDDPRYTERRLSSQDQVYRGSDGRYYCKRNDGTTGLIVGGAAGALAGNVIDGGRNRVAGTLIGGALGALLGKSVDQNQDVRCR